MMNETDIKQVYKDHLVNKEELRSKILDSVDYEQNVPKTPGGFKRITKLRPIIAAAAVLLLVIIGISSYSIIAEAKEYREAIEFFNEYELPTVGLTRSEIKAVYRDITMKTYSYEKTRELLKIVSAEVYSTDIGQADRDSMEALWNKRNNFYLTAERSEKQGEISYRVEVESIELDEYTPPYDKTYIVRKDGDTESWRYEIPYDMYVEADKQISICEEGAIIYGSKSDFGESKRSAYVFMLDNHGKLIWEHSEYANHSEYETAALSENEVALFGNRLQNYMSTEGSLSSQEYYKIFTVISLTGEIKENKETQLDTFTRYDAAVRIGDNYLVKQRVRESDYNMTPELISVSLDGETTNKFTYSENGQTYQIQDIIYYKGKVYLSAMLFNQSMDEFDDDFNDLMQQYYDACTSNTEGTPGDVVDMPDDYDEALREIFIRKCSAVLLVCDEEAVITKAYSVQDSQPGTLKLDDNNRLSWQILRVDDVKNVPLFISSRRLDILATEFAFIFDIDGKLIEKNEIGAYPIMY